VPAQQIIRIIRPLGLDIGGGFPKIGHGGSSVTASRPSG
jgi:hypothetical protein